MHCGRSDTAASANANSNTPRTSEFSPPNLRQKVANYTLRRNWLANANEIAKVSSSLRNFLANGSLQQFASDCECDGLAHGQRSLVAVRRAEASSVIDVNLLFVSVSGLCVVLCLAELV